MPHLQDFALDSHAFGARKREDRAVGESIDGAGPSTRLAQPYLGHLPR